MFQTFLQQNKVIAQTVVLRNLIGVLHLTITSDTYSLKSTQWRQPDSLGVLSENQDKAFAFRAISSLPALIYSDIKCLELSRALILFMPSICFLARGEQLKLVLKEIESGIVLRMELLNAQYCLGSSRVICLKWKLLRVFTTFWHEFHSDILKSFFVGKNYLIKYNPKITASL